MTEAEAMAVLVAGISAYGRREKALAAAGSALRILEEPEAYAAWLGPEGTASLRTAAARADGMLERMRRSGVTLLLRDSEFYPKLLRQIRHAPQLLFCAGVPDLTDAFPIAAVGTRKPSAYGERNARRIARELAAAGCCVVSGLALGIDGACHEGALEAGGRTVAVLGGALDRPYPRENLGLLDRILERGGSVVSEYPPGTSPSKYSFLHRNRIIAGMALGVFVAEGRARSGALSTANCALDEGREVFALPGSVEEPCAQLPHTLISEGARLVSSGADILRTLVIEPAAEPAPARREEENRGATVPAPAETKRMPEKPEELHVPPTLSGQEQAVCRALLEGSTDFDVLCEQTGIPSAELGSLLIEMEMDGLVEALPGNEYAPGEAMRRGI